MPFFCLVILCCCPVGVLAQHNCSSDTYDEGSQFARNLANILQDMPSNMGDSGYFNNSIGTDPDEVYVDALCRADTQLADCRNCISQVAEDIQQNCNSLKAYGWQEWCILRISNNSTSWSDNANCVSTDTSIEHPSIPDSQLVNLDALVINVSEIASLEGDSSDLMVAAGYLNGDPAIYTMVQCMPDLSADDCHACLNNAYQGRRVCSDNSSGTIIFTPECFLQYDTYSFYNLTRLQGVQGMYNVTVTPSEPTQLPSATDGAFTPPPTPSKSNLTTIAIAVAIPLVLVLLALGIVVGVIVMKRRSGPPAAVPNPQVGLQYTYESIKTSTSAFSNENILGRGGFGTVYKGQLESGEEIAVKRLSEPSMRGDSDFTNEIQLLANLRHRNLVRLFGFAIHGSEKMLVYEFFKNRSLDNFLFDPARRVFLDWNVRRRIIDGIAHGLQYIHHESHYQIIHRDLKAGNILLDDQMNPKIADFGVARLLSDETHANTMRIIGTRDYMAPEYIKHGLVSPKIDVYSFGVLVLEIISGQRIRLFTIGGKSEDMLSFAWKNWKDGTAENMMDPLLRDDTQSSHSILKCIQIGLLCVQEDPEDRPTMASAVHMLETLVINLPVPSQPPYFRQTVRQSPP